MCNVVPSVEELSKLSSKDPETCFICNKCFQGQSALKTHLKRSHKALNNEEEKKRYFCPLDNCSHNINSSFPFSSLSALKQHFKLVHGTMRFKCSRCERKFKSKYSRNQHEVECGVRYLCSCNIEYTTKRGLLEHVKRQNHEIPKRLQELFNQTSSKAKANLAATKKPIIRKTSRVILPKTFKKVRLFRLMAPSSLTASKPDQVTVVMPNSVLRNLSKKQENSSLLSVPRSNHKFLHVQDVSTHKHISIQTEPCDHGSRHWESNGHLHQTTGTQTVESMFEKAPIETYSTLSQTDLCHFVTSDLNSLPHIWNQPYTNSYSHQPITMCDAQNQTRVENSYFAVDDDLSKLTRNGYDTLASSSANVSASIETQTENEVNFLSTQTQTLGFSLPDQNDVETEMTLDVFLNDIETQTDLLLPALQESTSGFVNTCTQTPDKDFLSEILNLNS